MGGTGPSTTVAIAAVPPRASSAPVKQHIAALTAVGADQPCDRRAGLSQPQDCRGGPGARLPQAGCPLACRARLCDGREGSGRNQIGKHPISYGVDARTLGSTVTRSDQRSGDEFAVLIVERYQPHPAREQLLEDAVRLNQGMAGSGGERTLLRYLGSAFVPQDETCFLVFQGNDVAAAEHALQQAAISYERVVQAVCVPA